MTAAARLLASLRWLRRFTAVLLFGYDGFVSHARADGRPYAIALWAALEQLGLTICFDREDFHAGDPLQSTLRRTVRSSRCLILLDTPRARASRWVQDEVLEAIATRRPIVPVQHAEAPAAPWQPEPVATHLGALIHCDETAANFAQGVVRFEITDAIRASMTASTTRQRLRRAGLAIAGSAAVAAGVAVAANLASSRLDVLKWTLEDPGVSLEQALGDVRTFLRSPLGAVAVRGFPDSTDELLRQASAAAIKLHRLPAPPAGARVSTTDQAVVVLSGTTLEVRAVERVTTCTLSASAPVVAAGVNELATVAVGVTASSLLAWRLPECHPLVEAALPESGPAGRGQIGGIRVVGDGEEITALVWWQQQLLALVVAAAGVRVEGRLDAAALADGPGRDARFFDVSARPGAPVAFTVGVVDALVPDRLCLAAAGTLAFTWQCHYDAVHDFEIGPDGRYLLWSSLSGPLQLARLDAATQGNFSPEYSLAGSVLAVAVSHDAAVKLDTSGFATFLDVPSLNVLGARYVGPGGAPMLLGTARRAAYERVTPASVPPGTGVSATCGNRTIAAHSDSPGAVGPTVRDGAGEWSLPLTAVEVSATATVTAATFDENCGSLLVALENGTRSDVLAVDIVEPGVLSARRLARRAMREVAGRVRELRFDGTARGWATALVETTSDPPSVVRQRIPIDRGAVLEWLEVDRHASRSAVSLVVGR